MSIYPNAAHVKAALLSEGVRFSTAFLEAYDEPFLAKRRAYGNSDATSLRDLTLPQEVYIGPERIICGIHGRDRSPWMLDYCNHSFSLRYADDHQCLVDFPRTPKFYHQTLSTGRHANQIGTLYGGASLGVFAYGACALVDKNKACAYCSIGPNRARQTDFAEVVSPDNVYETTRLALECDGSTIRQVMINGGNLSDRDKSFAFYLRLCEAARRAIDDADRPDIELHLIVFPPKSMSLIDDLRDYSLSVAINIEVFAPSLFDLYCPGKTAEGGQRVLLNALERAVGALGAGSVFSILVGGLEPVDSAIAGFNFLGKLGVTPIVNVFHADPETPLADHPVPSYDTIIQLGYGLQSCYKLHNFMRPFYGHCGRNAIDTEAYNSQFTIE